MLTSVPRHGRHCTLKRRFDQDDMGFHSEYGGTCLHDVVRIHQEGKEPTEGESILVGPTYLKFQLNSSGNYVQGAC